MTPREKLARANFLQRWQLSPAELDEILAENPSLRGMIFGYVSEYKVKKTWFENHPSISAVMKPDDHDRKKKADLLVVYKGETISIEVKAL